MKKKVLATLLALSLLISLFSGITAFAAVKGSLTASLTTTTATIAAGDSLTLTIGADSFTTIDGGIIGATLNVAYDNTKYDFVSVTLAQSYTGVEDAYSLSGSVSNGVVSILYYDNAPSSPFYPLLAGAMFNVNFTAKTDAADGVTSFTLSGDNGTDDWADLTSTGSNTIEATYPSALEVTIQPAGTTYIRGDADGDSDVDIDDVNYLCDYLAWLSFPENDAHFQIYCDVDGNGWTDIDDVNYLCDWLAWLIFDETTGFEITIPN